jgi:hypothetical protein
MRKAKLEIVVWKSAKRLPAEYESRLFHGGPVSESGIAA